MAAASPALQERFEDAVRQAGDHASAVGDALFQVAGLLESRATVRRALTDPGRAVADREALARRLLGGRVDDAAVDVVAAAAHERWERPSRLASAMRRFGVQAHLAAAEANGRLSSVEDEVFRFTRVLGAEPALRSALLDRAAPTEAKSRLVRNLLEGKSHPETVRLVEYAVLERRERSLEEELDHIAELAADRQQQRVAMVRVAAALSDEHRDRLRSALSAQVGASVRLNVVVEPELIGGIKVEIGDEVVDGTILGRLDDARRRLVAGARPHS